MPWWAVALVLYVAAAIFSTGTTLVWTWEALLWLLGEAPIPIILLVVILPLLFVGVIVWNSVDITLPTKLDIRDRRRRNPPEPKDKTPRTPTPPDDEPKGPPEDIWREPERPYKEYTVHKKPKQPKIWGIDP